MELFTLSGGLLAGILAYFAVRVILSGFYTVNQSERAVKQSFGRAVRLTPDRAMKGPTRTEDAEGGHHYRYPRLQAIGPGGPYFKWPWEKITRVSVATQTVSMAFDPDSPKANQSGTLLEAVTKDQLNIDLAGQIRYRISEKNLYAYAFGVKSPIAHVMGYFISILRERIANFEARKQAGETDEVLAAAGGISINDLRKNLRDINEHMDEECRESESRYGIILDASLITSIDPPSEVESALAAINTAHNHVSSDVSLAQASADQKIVQSKRAVEIETLRAQAEVEPLEAMAEQLAQLKQAGPATLNAYRRNARLGLIGKAEQLVMRIDHA